MYRDEEADPPAQVCQVGSTTLKYHLSAIEDLHHWLTEQGGWVPLGAERSVPALSSTARALERRGENRQRPLNHVLRRGE